MNLRRVEERTDAEINYLDDAKLYIDIRQRYDLLKETDLQDAYQLMKDSLAVYDRWSKILFDIRRNETTKTRNPAFKNRIEDMCRILREINQECRMVWNRGEDDYRRRTH